MKRADETSLYLSVLTIGELEKGIAKLPLSSRTTRLETWVRSDLADRFRERLLAIDGTVAATWGKLAGEAEARADRRENGDALAFIEAQFPVSKLSKESYKERS